MTHVTTPSAHMSDRHEPEDSFSQELSVSTVDIEFELRAFEEVPWSPFCLNPRRLRGSDFLMRWSQGRWSEERFVHAVNETGSFFAMQYGPSSTAPDDVREFELYFERLDAAGLADVKRPDLLVYSKKDQEAVEKVVGEIGGVTELPFVREDDERIQEILRRAVIAVECENSLWKARQMPEYGAELRPMARLGHLPGLRKGAVLPTIIIKEEDRGRLRDWQNSTGVPIHIWHSFYDLAFGIPLNEVDELIQTGYIEATQQVFQSPGGSTSTKAIYKVYYHYAYPLGEATVEPDLIADHIVDKNGHILPYVRFEGGEMELTSQALEVLADLERG